ncbi:MAG: transposase [Candidatus Paceibacterota bacterium]|jgi:putative transposase
MQRKNSFAVGEYYHLYNRGINKRVIFQNDTDYRRFILLLFIANSKNSFRLDDLINKQKKTFEEILQMDHGETLVDIGAWVLMPNHFHILIREKTEGGISKFMSKLSTAYSMYFNIKNERTGALLCRPFKSVLVKDDIHLKHLFGYLHLNPLKLKFKDWQDTVKKGDKEAKEMKIFLDSYIYSSYLDYLGKERIENCIISTKKFPEYFFEEHEFENFIEDYLTDTSQGESLRNL